MIYSDYMADYDGEDTSWTDATNGKDYSPLFNGRLIQLRLYWAQTTAASVVTGLSAKVEGSTFGGRPAIVSLAGQGLMTAPAFPPPVGIFNCDLPVSTSNKLTVTFRHHAGAITPVTSLAYLIGVFEG
mgnify:CR=1 FL=1